MQKFSTTQQILQSKVQNTANEGGECLPCKAKQQNQAIWKIYVGQSEFLDSPNLKLQHIGNALQQYAKFTGPQVQSIFSTITLIPNEEYLIYSGDESTAIAIHNGLVEMGMDPKIEATLKKF